MVNGGLGPLAPPPAPGDPTSVIPLSGGYYQPPYIKPLSFTAPTYSPGLSHRLDSTHVTPYSGQPVLMDGFVQPSTPHNQRGAIKVYSNTGSVMMCPQIPYSYKMNPAANSSPAQLSDGSSPYSDTTMSPLFASQGLGKTEPPSDPPQGHTSGPTVPLHGNGPSMPLPGVKEELASMESQQGPEGNSYVPVTSSTDMGAWGSSSNSDSVWASPEQATPSSARDSDDERNINPDDDR